MEDRLGADQVQDIFHRGKPQTGRDHVNHCVHSFVKETASLDDEIDDEKLDQLFNKGEGSEEGRNVIGDIRRRREIFLEKEFGNNGDPRR